MKNRKKLVFLLVVIAALVLLSGCSIPTETDPETGKTVTKLITEETTFKSMMGSESWFNAFFVYPLAQAINKLAPKTGVGFAIALVTVIVNLLVVALTFKSTLGTQKMQLIQPEMQKIQKKYEGKTDEASQMKMSQETMALYKKHGINPIGSMLTLFLQMPILVAIYHAVQRSVAVKTGTFMGLSLEQTPLDGIKAGQFAYIILFAVMICCQMLSMKLPQWIAAYKAKKEAAARHKKYVKTEQPGGNSMMIMMLAIFVMAIAWPAAMTLYWIISSLVNVLKTLLMQVILNKSMSKEK